MKSVSIGCDESAPLMGNKRTIQAIDMKLMSLEANGIVSS